MLLDALDKEFHLTVLITGNLITGDMDELRKEIHKKYYAVELNAPSETNTLEGMTCNALEVGQKVWDRFCKKKPDALVLWADRFELLPVALVANYMGIPLIHIQGGEVSGNVDNYVRNAVSMLSQLHCVSHSEALGNLKKFGLKNVYDTGCPSIDVIEHITFEKPTHDYVVCLFHPHTEELDKAHKQTEKLLNSVVSYCEDKKFSIYWFAPNNDPGHKEVLKAATNVTIIKNLIGEKYLQLLNGAKMIVGNSSSGIREASYMGVPAVVVGDRQINRLMATNALHCDFDNIKDTMDRALKLYPRPSRLFGDGKASYRITKIIKDYLWEKSRV